MVKKLHVSVVVDNADIGRKLWRSLTDFKGTIKRQKILSAKIACLQILNFIIEKYLCINAKVRETIL